MVRSSGAAVYKAVAEVFAASCKFPSDRSPRAIALFKKKEKKCVKPILTKIPIQGARSADEGSLLEFDRCVRFVLLSNLLGQIAEQTERALTRPLAFSKPRLRFGGARSATLSHCFATGEGETFGGPAVSSIFPGRPCREAAVGFTHLQRPPLLISGALDFAGQSAGVGKPQNREVCLSGRERSLPADAAKALFHTTASRPSR